MMSKEIHSAAEFEKEITNHKGYALVFKDGKPVKRMSGYRPLDAFVEELKSAVES